MVRLFGLGKKPGKKRRSPTVSTLPVADEHPLYEYALKEYAQTVPPGSSNDDGRLSRIHSYASSQWSTTYEETITVTNDSQYSMDVEVIRPPGHSSTPHSLPRPPSGLQASRGPRGVGPASMAPHSRNSTLVTSQPQQRRRDHQQQQHQHHAGDTDDDDDDDDDDDMEGGGPLDHDSIRAMPTETDAPSVYSSSLSVNQARLLRATRSPFENDMPDAVYQEHYGEAYTGGPIKFIYPSGYTSMRPRSGPWKLSIVVCLFFTWLSVFIVGHCSDQVVVVDANGGGGGGNNGNNNNNRYRGKYSLFDDDKLTMELRWCGSRPLYLMWVASVLVTAASAAYCSIIGYIKVRDFVVANSRSQPPGVAEGKSDYYVRIEAGPARVGSGPPAARHPMTASSSSPYPHHQHVAPSIYQADGTPQFWGAHIYRPTQAAVAITSR